VIAKNIRVFFPKKNEDEISALFKALNKEYDAG